METEKMYTKSQIETYLKMQTDIESAIKNIDMIDSDFVKIVDDNNKIILYFKKGSSKKDVKQMLIKYMGENGWEKSGYEDIMLLSELLGILKLKIIN